MICFTKGKKNRHFTIKAVPTPPTNKCVHTNCNSVFTYSVFTRPRSWSWSVCINVSILKINFLHKFFKIQMIQITVDKSTFFFLKLSFRYKGTRFVYKDLLG
jgi:hypothetical protein